MSLIIIKTFRVSDIRKALKRDRGKCCYHRKAFVCYQVTFKNDPRYCINIWKKAKLKNFLKANLEKVAYVYKMTWDRDHDCSMFKLDKRTLKPTGWLKFG